MRVDFYQLNRDPASAATAMLARKTRESGRRLLIVSSDPDQLGEISEALWQSAPEAFLANGIAGGQHDARQPILLSGEVLNANNAEFLLLADGNWREQEEGFARIMLLFDSSTIDGARDTWRSLGKTSQVERRYWKQQGGRWVEGP